MQELPANNFLQDAVWPISTFHVGPDQPDPTRNHKPSPSPIPTPDSRPSGAVARLRFVVWWRFSQKKRTAENPVSTNKSMRPTSYGRGVPLFFSEAFFSFLRSSLLLYRTQNTDWLREKNERMPNQMSNG